MRELSLNEIEMVSGGRVPHGTGGGGGLGNIGGSAMISIGVGSVSTTSGYVGGKIATNDKNNKRRIDSKCSVGGR